MRLQVYKSVEQARANGAVVIHEPEKLNGTTFAFVQDHDGYKFKFIQTPSLIDPLSQIMLRVQDLDLSANFYSKVTSNIHKYISKKSNKTVSWYHQNFNLCSNLICRHWG